MGWEGVESFGSFPNSCSFFFEGFPKGYSRTHEGTLYYRSLMCTLGHSTLKGTLGHKRVLYALGFSRELKGTIGN